MNKFAVEKGRMALTNDNGELTCWVSAQCHHRVSGACGGCYARFWVAITTILDQGGDAHKILGEVRDAMISDKKLRQKDKKP